MMMKTNNGVCMCVCVTWYFLGPINDIFQLKIATLKKFVSSQVTNLNFTSKDFYKGREKFILYKNNH